MLKLPKNLSVHVSGDKVLLNQKRRGQIEVIELTRKQALALGILLVKNA